MSSYEYTRNEKLFNWLVRWVLRYIPLAVFILGAVLVVLGLNRDSVPDVLAGLGLAFLTRGMTSIP